MKYITLRQPWATLVALGLKRYETRSWDTDYRGDLVIHAAARPMRKDEVTPILYGACGINLTAELEQLNVWLNEFLDTGKQSLPLGAFVCLTRLSDCKEMVQACRSSTAIRDKIAISQQLSTELSVGCWEPGRFAMRLYNVQALTPIPFKAQQGKLIDVPTEFVWKVNLQLETPDHG